MVLKMEQKTMISWKGSSILQARSYFIQSDQTGRKLGGASLAFNGAEAQRCVPHEPKTLLVRVPRVPRMVPGMLTGSSRVPKPAYRHND